VEKTLTAGQAAAEKAVKASKETAEKAFKAGSDAVAKAYDQAFAAAKDQVQKTFPQAAEKFDEFAGFQKANLEALFAAGSAAMKGFETLSDEVLALNKKAMEDGLAGAKKLMECKTVQEMMELQGEIARAQVERMFSTGTKVSEMCAKVATDMTEPLQARLGKAAEKMAAPISL
jgi:phasin family protein